MLYGATDLASAFRTVRSNTIRTAEDIPEAQLDFAAAPGVRTVRQLLAHLAMNDEVARVVHQQKLTTLQGLNFPEIMGRMMAEEQKPRTKAELIAMLRERGEEYASWLGSLSEEFLAEHVGMPSGAEPTSKTRFEMLLAVKEHEMHHRAQLMLAQRMVGVVPHLTRQMQERMAAARP